MFPIPQFTEGSLYILPCGKSVGEGGERGFIAYEKEKINYNLYACIGFPAGFVQQR